MAMICFGHTLRAVGSTKVTRTTLLSGQVAVLYGRECNAAVKVSFGWCRVKLRKVGIGIGWSWSVDQFPPTLLHSTILTSEPRQGDGVVKDFFHSVLAGQTGQGVGDSWSAACAGRGTGVLCDGGSPVSRERVREGQRQKEKEKAANDLWTLETDSDIPDRSRTRAFVHSLIYSTVSTPYFPAQQLLLLQWCMA